MKAFILKSTPLAHKPSPAQSKSHKPAAAGESLTLPAFAAVMQAQEPVRPVGKGVILSQEKVSQPIDYPKSGPVPSKPEHKVLESVPNLPEMSAAGGSAFGRNSQTMQLHPSKLDAEQPPEAPKMNLVQAFIRGENTAVKERVPAEQYVSTQPVWNEEPAQHHVLEQQYLPGRGHLTTQQHLSDQAKLPDQQHDVSSYDLPEQPPSPKVATPWFLREDLRPSLQDALAPSVKTPGYANRPFRTAESTHHPSEPIRQSDQTLSPPVAIARQNATPPPHPVETARPEGQRAIRIEKIVTHNQTSSAVTDLIRERATGTAETVTSTLVDRKIVAQDFSPGESAGKSQPEPMISVSEPAPFKQTITQSPEAPTQPLSIDSSAVPEPLEINSDFQVQIVRPQEGSSETLSSNSQSQLSASDLNPAPLETAGPEAELPSAEPALAHNGAFNEILEAAPHPAESNMATEPSEPALAPSGDQPPQSQAESLPAGGPQIDGRGGAPARLETPAGGSASSPRPALFFSGKGAVRVSQALRLKPKTGAGKPVRRAAAQSGKTAPSQVQNSTPDPQVDEALTTAAPEGTAKPLPLRQPASAPLRLQHIQNLRELADKIQARARMMTSSREALLVKLNPPHLGLLRVQVETDGKEISLAFSAEKPDAVQALKESRAELAQVVSEQGYSLVRCDVDSQPQADRRAESYLADQPRRQAAHPRATRNQQPAEHDDSPTGQHQPLDLGYNTLDLVA